MAYMEDWLLNVDEYNFLKKFKSRIEENFDVKITLPHWESCFMNSDLILVAIYGNEESLRNVKDKMEKHLKKSKSVLDDEPTVIYEGKKEPLEEQSVIFLSDSESEVCSEDLNIENSIDESVCIIEDVVQNISMERPSNRLISDLHTVNSIDESVCIIDDDIGQNTSMESPSNRSVSNIADIHQNISKENSFNKSVCVVEEISSNSNSYQQSSELNSNKRKLSNSQNKKKKKKIIKKSISVSVEIEEICEVSKTDSRCILDDKNSEPAIKSGKSAPDFIPLTSFAGFSKRPNETKANCSTSSNSVSKVEKPLENRVLRPIVIDGSNVAMSHGKKNHTFSTKGIKIAIDYFLKRGHTKVTAFVPQSRRHREKGKYPTTDLELLEELAEQQLVVFTPARRVNGVLVTAYDDRFIVQLATMTGGVILSNDNYRDIAAESEEFKKTIEERLLMFCFVDDILMIPEDPLGRTGPSIDEYLSFKPDEIIPES